MCTRFFMERNTEQQTIAAKAKESPLTERIALSLSRPLCQEGEVHPTDLVPVLATTPKGMQGVYPMIFGFSVPGIDHPLLNARVETAEQKELWRECLLKRRCAIPASYYFEWEHLTKPGGLKVTGEKYMTCYAAETLEELGRILGYSGKPLEEFLSEVDRYNAFCAAGRDEDWGCDPGYLFPIEQGPFFGVVRTVTADIVNGGLNQLAGVCTDGCYNVVDGSKHPIPGLYAAGNTCGQRYAVQYHTPTAGNTCGSALTGGYVAAEHVARFLGVV